MYGDLRCRTMLVLEGAVAYPGISKMIVAEITALLSNAWHVDLSFGLYR